MFVREDDTLVCRGCYDDEGGDHVYRPAHREIHATVTEGACDGCGKIITDERRAIPMNAKQIKEQEAEDAIARQSADCILEEDADSLRETWLGKPVTFNGQVVGRVVGVVLA